MQMIVVDKDFPPIICHICFCTVSETELEPVSDEPGEVWDVCRKCAAKDKEHGAVY